MGQPLLGPMVEQFLENYSLWERPTLEWLVKDCIPLKGLHREQGSRRDELLQTHHSSPLLIVLGSSLANGHRHLQIKSNMQTPNLSCNSLPDAPLQSGTLGKAICYRHYLSHKVKGKKKIKQHKVLG